MVRESQREKIVTIEPEEDSLMKPWFSSSLVARAKQLTIVDDIHSLTSLAKVDRFQFRYLGGLFLLLSFPSHDEADAFLKARKTWKIWFSNMEQWQGQSIPYERIPWLRIHAI
ncbi:hypothetical protein QVD17_30561 [Tagetes erecta]|uniref:Uncharacterized protein n=1 Tax=Tagetes erecta TaxID=13708 RepID=A0AAD8K230_TARER|nr:hypothetical protein QVD17_30561 [Tagetes erecta]